MSLQPGLGLISIFVLSFACQGVASERRLVVSFVEMKYLDHISDKAHDNPPQADRDKGVIHFSHHDPTDAESEAQLNSEPLNAELYFGSYAQNGSSAR